MNTFFLGLDKLLGKKRRRLDNHLGEQLGNQLPMDLAAMVTPDSQIHAAVVMLPVLVRATGRRRNLAPRPVQEQRLGYKAYLLFGVSKASVPAELFWARDAMCKFFR